MHGVDELLVEVAQIIPVAELRTFEPDVQAAQERSLEGGCQFVNDLHGWPLLCEMPDAELLAGNAGFDFGRTTLEGALYCNGTFGGLARSSCPDSFGIETRLLAQSGLLIFCLFWIPLAIFPRRPQAPQ